VRVEPAVLDLALDIGCMRRMAKQTIRPHHFWSSPDADHGISPRCALRSSISRTPGRLLAKKKALTSLVVDWPAPRHSEAAYESYGLIPAKETGGGSEASSAAESVVIEKLRHAVSTYLNLPMPMPGLFSIPDPVVEG